MSSFWNDRPIPNGGIAEASGVSTRSLAGLLALLRRAQGRQHPAAERKLIDAGCRTGKAATETRDIGQFEGRVDNAGYPVSVDFAHVIGIEYQDDSGLCVEDVQPLAHVSSLRNRNIRTARIGCHVPSGRVKRSATTPRFSGALAVSVGSRRGLIRSRRPLCPRGPVSANPVLNLITPRPSVLAPLLMRSGSATDAGRRIPTDPGCSDGCPSCST